MGDPTVPPPVDASVGSRAVAPLGELFSRSYADLRCRARALLTDAAGPSITPTVLVHEAYLKLQSAGAVQCRDHSHFCSLVARAMRQIAIDRTRARLAAKRGGGLNPLDLEDWIVADEDLGRSLLALDTALDDLAARDPRLAAMVELRFFVGMSVKETAASLGVTGRTVKRGWRLARAFLCARMDEAEFGAEVSSSGAGASGKSPTARRPARPGRKPPDR